MSDFKIYNMIMGNPPIKSLIDNGDFQGATDALNLKNIQKKDNHLVTARQIMKTFTTVVDVANMLNESDIILNALQNSSHPRTKAAYDSLTSDGLDISDEQVQGMIPIIASLNNWPVGLSDKLKSLGVWYVSIAEQNGFSEPLTLQQVQDDWNAGVALAVKTGVRLFVEERWNIHVEPVIHSGNKTLIATALRAIADELEV